MGKARKERTGRQRLRTAYKRIKRDLEEAQADDTSQPVVDAQSSGQDEARIAGDEDGDEMMKPSRFERKLKKRAVLMEKLGKGRLGVKKAAMKKSSASRKRGMFSLGSLMEELDNVDSKVQVNFAKREKRRHDFSKHRSRYELMAQFSQQVSQVNSNPAYVQDPLGATIHFLQEALPAPRTREELSEQWKSEQRKLAKKRGKKRLGWYDK